MSASLYIHGSYSTASCPAVESTGPFGDLCPVELVLTAVDLQLCSSYAAVGVLQLWATRSKCLQ